MKALPIHIKELEIHPIHAKDLPDGMWMELDGTSHQTKATALCMGPVLHRLWGMDTHLCKQYKTIYIFLNGAIDVSMMNYF